MFPKALIGAAFAAGLAVAGAGSWAVNEWIENPIVRAAEQQKAVAIAEAAAAKATRDEQLRQFRIGEAEANRAELARRENEAWHQAQLDLLNTEIADYVAQAQKHSLDQCDLDFIGGLRCQRPGAAAGGR